MGEEEAIAALTLLVAVCEQAMLELERLEPPYDGAVDRIARTRDEAVDVVRALQPALLTHPSPPEG